MEEKDKRKIIKSFTYKLSVDHKEKLDILKANARCKTLSLYLMQLIDKEYNNSVQQVNNKGE